MATVDSSQIWNDTGVRIEQNRRYRYTAVGRWVDKTYDCDANGYDSPNLVMKLAEFKRRVRHARWFQLIGSVDRNADLVIVMGTNGEFVAPATGQLTCFANDWMSKYDNNRGSVELTVTPL